MIYGLLALSALIQVLRKKEGNLELMGLLLEYFSFSFTVLAAIIIICHTL